MVNRGVDYLSEMMARFSPSVLGFGSLPDAVHCLRFGKLGKGCNSRTLWACQTGRQCLQTMFGDSRTSFDRIQSEGDLAGFTTDESDVD